MRAEIQGMKIYFGFTVAGDRSSLVAARRMVDLLEAMGHEVLTRHLVSDDAARMDRSLAPQEVYERDMEWLRQCDIFIAEVSGSSFGLGYETGFVLGSSGKKAVLFYRRDAAPRISLLITGNTHPNCRLVPYSDGTEIAEHLRSTMSA
jgi:nucleoside 2-deoxyribosyltransferase